MNDDWRVQVGPEKDAHTDALLKKLDSKELQHDLSDAYHDQVVVTRDGPQVYLYTGTRQQAEGARELIDSLANQHEWAVKVELKHWHQVASEWLDPEAENPDVEAATETEHDEALAAERQLAEERGFPEFEVRVELPSRHEAAGLARRLQMEGLLPVRRWKYLLIGTTDEDHANELADRLRAEVPAHSHVKVELTRKAVLAQNPFTAFHYQGP